MLTYKRRYLNAATTDPDIDPNKQILATTGEPIKPESKVWGFMDNLFGAADKSADIYGKIRQTQLYGPQPYGTTPPVPQRNPNTTAIVIGGSVVAVIVLVLILKK